MQTKYSPKILGKKIDIYFFAVITISLVGILQLCRLSFMPQHIFLNHIIYDDTVYYSQIAENFWKFHFFTFDGVNQTNGFQPAWELTAVLLASIVKNQFILLRVLSILSGVCWILGAAILSLAIRKISSKISSLIFFFGMIINPLFISYAAKGMETGLLFLGLGILLHSLVPLIISESKSQLNIKYWKLWCVLTLLFLTRVDQILILVAIGLLIIFIRPGHNLWQNFGFILKIAMVPILMFILYVLSNLVFFSTFLPVSGSVKSFYVNANPFPKSFIEMVGYIFRYVFDISTYLFGRTIPSWLWQKFQFVINQESLVNSMEYAFIVLFLSVVTIAIFRVLKRGKIFTNQQFCFLAFGVYVLIHYLSYLATLPNFLIYGTWYFLPEYILVWLIIAVGTGYALERIFRELKVAQRILIAITMIGIIFTASQYQPPTLDPRTSRFELAGRWFNSNYPHGRIGAFSSGILSLTASQATVINLDGLVNSEDYLINYLQKNRLPIFIQKERLQFISDYWDNSVMKLGVAWSGRIPLEQLVVLKVWKVDDSHTYVIYGVRQFLSQSEIELLQDPKSQRAFSSLIA